jgi:hypothetical protein
MRRHTPRLIDRLVEAFWVGMVVLALLPVFVMFAAQVLRTLAPIVSVGVVVLVVARLILGSIKRRQEGW